MGARMERRSTKKTRGRGRHVDGWQLYLGLRLDLHAVRARVGPLERHACACERGLPLAPRPHTPTRRTLHRGEDVADGVEGLHRQCLGVADVDDARVGEDAEPRDGVDKDLALNRAARGDVACVDPGNRAVQLRGAGGADERAGRAGHGLVVARGARGRAAAHAPRPQTAMSRRHGGRRPPHPRRARALRTRCRAEDEWRRQMSRRSTRSSRRRPAAAPQRHRARGRLPQRAARRPAAKGAAGS